MIVKKFAGLSVIFIMLSLICMPGCAINDAISGAINNSEKPDKNEQLFLDGMLFAYQGEYDQAYEVFDQVEQSHHLYLLARKEMEDIDLMRAQPQATPKPVKKISARQLAEYKKLMGEAKAYADKKEYELAYLSYHRAKKEVVLDKGLSNIVQTRKMEMEPKALSAIQTKLQKADALDQKYEFQEIIDMLRPIAQVPLMSKEVQDKLASALHKLALVNYQQSKYKIAADLFEEEYQYRPEKSVKELSIKARKLSEALESN
ncbi:MAG: hypothetical protein JEZ02_00480 [Desulfatibacillum sp.]|nr:hypothetical protein [Desulfatibacillum sp.]